MFSYEYQYNNEVNLNGIFIGLVVDNADPKALERVKVRVIGVHDMENEDPDNSIWCSHIAPSKSGSGELPDKDDYIYVTFLQGDPMSALWLGWCRVIG